jgi:type I restriction enzyme S subunit
MAGDLINCEIPDHWEFTTLGDVCQRGGGSIQTGPFGSQLHASDYVPVGIPSIMPTNIGDNRIVEEGIVRITEQDAIRLGQHRLRAGDIVYSRRGDVERRALIREREEGWLCGTGCLKVRLGSGVVDPLFASMFLGHPAIREWIVRHAVGATMPNLNTSIMSTVPFALPPIAEQKAIAAVLGTLDDKIELNRRMNATLEAMARALFQSWFVDFDPVRAKLDGREPVGLDSNSAALFPQYLDNSTLGIIPKGWQVNRISEVVEEVFDGPHATPPHVEEGPIFLGIKNLTGSALALSDTRCISESDWPRWTKRVTPKPLDIVFSYEATLGFFALIPPGLRCCLGRRLALIRPRAEDGHSHFWFHQFIGPDFQRYLIQHSVQGATVDRIPLIQFPNYFVLNPPSALKEAFECRVAPLWAKIHTNAKQSRTLATLRDTLLPKLLSGELSVETTKN